MTDIFTQRPFVLNRKPLPYILVYGDEADRNVSKILWAAISSTEIKLENANSLDELYKRAPDSLLTVICFKPGDEAYDVGLDLANNPSMIGHVMGITASATTEDRVAILASGYDSVFNLEMAASLEFPSVIRHKVEKAKIRQTNRIMQEEYQRFRAALTASPDAFIVFDNDRRIFFVSEHYRRAYPNIADKMIRGLHVMDAFELARREQGVGDNDPRYGLMKKFWETLQGQVEFSMGDNRIWRIKAAPLTDGQGTIVTTTDITDIVEQRREIEEKSRQLAIALEKEKEASNLQKQFIGMVSHEFRTPLSIIDGHAQMILRRGSLMEKDALERRCKTIRSAVSRLVNMMESVLSSNMLKTGRIDPDPEVYDLRALIAELCEEQMALSNNHVITWSSDLLPETVKTDRKMMTLILSNLLSNAVKFTRGTPRINVLGTLMGNEIKVDVIDNGIGIPENEVQRVFERYYRATTAAGIPGTGIGLNLVQELVNIQGGRIEIDSEQNQGTRVSIYLRNLA